LRRRVLPIVAATVGLSGWALVGTTPAGASPPGWGEIAPGADSAGPSAAKAALAAAQPTTPQPAGLNNQNQLQEFRTLIATLRAQQFNSLVTSFEMEEYAAAVAAQKAETAATTAAAAQAAQAAAAVAAAAAGPVAPGPPGAGGAPAGGVWAALRQCESSGNYADNTGNGYYGAYQFALATWQGLGYSGLPSQAAPSVQDAAAAALEVRSGWGQWPACAAKLGLL